MDGPVQQLHSIFLAPPHMLAQKLNMQMQLQYKSCWFFYFFLLLQKTHLRVEALGNDVVVVGRLFRHGGDCLGIPGFVNNEPVCGNEKSESAGSNNRRVRKSAGVGSKISSTWHVVKERYNAYK